MTGNTRPVILLIAAAIAACHLCIAQANAAELTLEDPNGGERLVAGQTYTITWQGPEEINNVLLEYSSNSGSDWTEVDANAPNTGAYDWLVPHITSNQCLVRISDVNDPDVNDVSDSVFAVYICYLAYDLNHDCIMNFLDVALLASEWPLDGRSVLFFNYTIDANGTEDINTYPDQPFEWTVTTTATETWIQADNNNLYVSCEGYNWNCTHYLYPTDPNYDIYNWNYSGSSSFRGGRDNGTYIDTTNNRLFIRTFSGGDIDHWCCGGYDPWSGNCRGWCNDPLNGYWRATYHINVTRTSTLIATESGRATVNATEGNKFIANFSLDLPPAQHSGTVVLDSRTITDDNPNVTTSIVIGKTGEVYATTDYSQIVTQPWSDTETGIGSIHPDEGDKYIITSSIAAPNGDTTWSVTDDNDLIITWMVENDLFANVP